MQSDTEPLASKEKGREYLIDRKISLRDQRDLSSQQQSKNSEQLLHPTKNPVEVKTLQIAIVEDEPLLCNFYSLALTRNRHKVTLALEKVSEVLDAIDENKLEGTDVAMIDYRLGGPLNGLEVAGLILQKYPNMRIVIATADDSIAKQVQALNFSYLQKPFGIADLMKCLNDKVESVAKTRRNIKRSDVFDLR